MLIWFFKEDYFIYEITSKRQLNIFFICIKYMYNSLKGLCDLVDTIEEEKKKERSKPSVERKNYPSEKKYNEYVKDLYKSKKYKMNNKKKQK